MTVKKGTVEQGKDKQKCQWCVYVCVYVHMCTVLVLRQVVREDKKKERTLSDEKNILGRENSQS